MILLLGSPGYIGTAFARFFRANDIPFLPNNTFRFFEDEQQFMSVAAKTPRSNCVLDSGKLLSTGIRLTPVEEAIERSLRDWSESPTSAAPTSR